MKILATLLLLLGIVSTVLSDGEMTKSRDLQIDTSANVDRVLEGLAVVDVDGAEVEAKKEPKKKKKKKKKKEKKGKKCSKKKDKKKKDKEKDKKKGKKGKKSKNKKGKKCTKKKKKKVKKKKKGTKKPKSSKPSMSPTIAPSSSPSTGGAVAETVFNTVLEGDCSLEQMDDSQLAVFEETMEDIIGSSNPNVTSVNVTVTDQQLNQTGCARRMLVSGRQLQTEGSSVLTMVSILIVGSSDPSSAEKAVDEAPAVMNTPENLEKVETTLEEKAGINITTCKVTDTGSTEVGCSRDTTVPSLSFEPSLSPTFSPTFMQSLFNDTNSPTFSPTSGFFNVTENY